MISIQSDDKKVIVKIDYGYPVKNYNQVFEINEGHPVYASLIAENLKENMLKNLENIRRESYEQGWKDAKSKKKKETFFSGYW